MLLPQRRVQDLAGPGLSPARHASPRAAVVPPVPPRYEGPDQRLQACGLESRRRREDSEFRAWRAGGQEVTFGVPILKGFDMIVMIVAFWTALRY